MRTGKTAMQKCPRCKARNYPIVKDGIPFCGNPNCGADLYEAQVRAEFVKVNSRLLIKHWKELGLTRDELSYYRQDPDSFIEDYDEELGDELANYLADASLD